MEVPCNPLYLTILIVIATHLRLWLIIGVQVYMAKFGRSSRERLATCDERLQKVFNEVIKYVDCSIIEGHRSGERQNKLYEEGKTKVKYPHGRHNANPSRAVDVVPYPIDRDDRERFHLFAGFVLGIAQSMEINIRWGGDWDSDGEIKDNGFDDLVHIEIRG